MDGVLTKDMIDEYLALIEALAPEEAPEGSFLVKGVSGLTIVKGDALPENTIMVSKRLFDLIYTTGEPKILGAEE